MIPSGIEPATFQLVAQCLNRLQWYYAAKLFALSCTQNEGYSTPAGQVIFNFGYKVPGCKLSRAIWPFVTGGKKKRPGTAGRANLWSACPKWHKQRFILAR